MYENIYFYLWDCSKSIYNVYRVLRNYYKVTYSTIRDTPYPISYDLPEVLTTELLKEQGIPLMVGLSDLAAIHDGFLSIRNNK